MTAPNHLVGGFYTHWYFRFSNRQQYSEWSEITAHYSYCLLPYIEHNKSLNGKVYLHISRVLNRRYGHHTITHSLMALVALTGIVSVFQSSFSFQEECLW